MSFPTKAPSSHPPGLKLGALSEACRARYCRGGPGAVLSQRGHGRGRACGRGRILLADGTNARLDAGGGHRAAAVAAAAPARRERAGFDIEEQQTLREVVELLVRVRVACPHGRILTVGEPFVAVAYLMAIEGRDLQGTWRLVTGEALSRKVYREVHGVLGKFAKDVEEEGKRLARDEERQHLLFEEYSPQPQRKRRKK